MHQNNTGSIIIVDNERDGLSVGIIPERDIARVLSELQPWLMNAPLRSIMSKPLVTIHTNASLKDGIQTMYSRNIRRLPVVSSEEKPWGNDQLFNSSHDLLFCPAKKQMDGKTIL